MSPPVPSGSPMWPSGKPPPSMVRPASPLGFLPPLPAPPSAPEPAAPSGPSSERERPSPLHPSSAHDTNSAHNVRTPPRLARPARGKRTVDIFSISLSIFRSSEHRHNTEPFARRDVFVTRIEEAPNLVGPAPLACISDSFVRATSARD